MPVTLLLLAFLLLLVLFLLLALLFFLGLHTILLSELLHADGVVHDGLDAILLFLHDCKERVIPDLAGGVPNCVRGVRHAEGGANLGSWLQVVLALHCLGLDVLVDLATEQVLITVDTPILRTGVHELDSLILLLDGTIGHSVCLQLLITAIFDDLLMKLGDLAILGLLLLLFLPDPFLVGEGADMPALLQIKVTTSHVG